jgi:ubiquinone/menaquinone biosynthesis C-methylase UbiE
MQTPSYLRAVDIHCQPGGYDWEGSEDDVAAGAIYDQGVYIYAMGRMGTLNDDMGLSQASYIRNQMPGIKPKRILDLGCAVGHSTIPYKTLFPDAQVYAIDVSAPILRYAHARAEALETPIYFSQQNAEETNFDDNSFDLIVSHILLHETSNKAISNIMKECRRLLKNGGWMIHSETPPYANMSPFDAFILDWDAKNNNEPFWTASHELNPKDIAKSAGFKNQTVFETMAPSAFELSNSKRTHVFQGGDFGGAGLWYIFGMQK